MSAASAAVAVPIDTLNPVRAPSAVTARTPAEIRKTAEDFEAAFLSSMLQPIFNQLPTDGMFGGGQGEQAFKSLMVDAMARQMARAGGVGLSDAVARQMLIMQGLSPIAAPDGSPAPTPPVSGPVPADA